MRKLMRRLSIAFALAVAGVFLLSLPPTARAKESDRGSASSAWNHSTRSSRGISRLPVSDLQRASELRSGEGRN